MVDRASVFEGLQLGVETTPGTAPGTGANKLLPSVVLSQTIQADATMYKTNGGKYNVTSALAQESWEASVSGPATYQELSYLISSAIQGGITPTTTGTTGKQWVFQPNQSAPDNQTTFEIQTGSSVRAQQIDFVIMPDIAFEFTRKEVKLSGKMIGQKLQDGISLTATPTAIALIPIVPNQVSIFLDLTAGAIGTTRLTRCLSAKWSSTGKVGELWTIDASQASFANDVELMPKTTMDLTLEADVNGMALLTDIRNGTTVYVRINCLGPAIPGGTANNTLNIDGGYVVQKVGSFSDNEGVYAIGFTLEALNDTSAGGFGTVKFTLINALASL
jgi:hypothetical protein